MVVAGAYDERLPQARAYMSDLLAIVDRLGLQNQVQPRQRLLPCDLCRLPCPPAPSHRAEHQDCEHRRSQLCTQISFIDWQLVAAGWQRPQTWTECRLPWAAGVAAAVIHDNTTSAAASGVHGGGVHAHQRALWHSATGGHGAWPPCGGMQQWWPPREYRAWHNRCALALAT